MTKNCETCQKSFRTFLSRLKRGQGRFCSRECRPAWNTGSRGIMKAWNKGVKGYLGGEKHYKYKTDRSLVKTGDRLLNDPLQKEWSRKVKNRDHWRCRIADVKCNGRLEAHHILPWSDYPELRYQVNNGITLCHAHHPRKREDVAKLSPYFQSLVASLD